MDTAMKVKTVFVFMDHKKERMAHATLEVPGLGEIKVEHALSTRLCEEIVAEAIVATRSMLGQVQLVEATKPKV